MASRIVAPYGSWPSPVTAAEIAHSGVTLQNVRAVGDEVWWSEMRPDDGGRNVVVRRDAGGQIADLLPAGWNARTRVHEYGGMAWLPVPRAGGSALVFAHWDDQRLYRLDAGSAEPVPLTPAADEPADLRYADPVLAPSGDAVWCVREAHRGRTVSRSLVTVPLDGSAAAGTSGGRGDGTAGAVRELVSGSDFLAYPRPSPDGTLLAWLAWDHPRMPWDGTELRVAPLSAHGTVGEVRTLLGGPQESVFQPEWADAGYLYAVSDRSGWWNLYRVPVGGGEPEPLHPAEEEFADPLWGLGMRTYAAVGDGRLVVRHGTDTDALGVLDPATGTLTDLHLPFSKWDATVHADGGRVVGVASGPVEAPVVVRVDPATGAVERLQVSQQRSIDPAYLPRPRSVTVAGPGGREVHAHVYPPASPDAAAPEGERPPYVVFVHGGPTSQAPAPPTMAKAYFTSRGIGVLDVNYGGSTGYGRAYRERLRGQWGVVDVEDCVAAAQALVEAGEADGARLAIRGASAGGWTTLAALTRTDVFAAGASYYGVAELLHFVQETHDFESRYVESLVGELPRHRDRYVERAPLSHVDELSCPVLLLQGLEDRVVPPSQAEMFAEALARNGIRHAYLAFPGEQHGFRRAETIIAAAEAELSFYGQVFGFTPPGVPVLPLSGGGLGAGQPAGANADSSR